MSYSPNHQWPPDAATVDAARNGNRQVLTTMLATGVPKLVAFYRGMGFSVQDAEDMAADASESIVRHLPRLRNPQTFEAWFWRIARNKYHDHLRKRRRTAGVREIEPVDGMPEDGVVLESEHEAVRTAFLTLPVRDRELLWLREVVGMEYGDIAGRMSATSGAARVAVMRARRRLEEALAKVEGEE
jgi:RNA polymerase sigma-70 factor, ECF subfamily